MPFGDYSISGWLFFHPAAWYFIVCMDIRVFIISPFFPSFPLISAKIISIWDVPVDGKFMYNMKGLRNASFPLELWFCPDGLRPIYGEGCISSQSVSMPRMFI